MHLKQINFVSELMDLIPMFFQRRFIDLENIKSSLLDGDFNRIQRIAHDIRGISGTYGFEELGDLAMRLEFCKDQDLNEIQTIVEAIEAHLNDAEIQFKEVKGK